MQLLKLRNGSEEPKPAVITTMQSLKALFESNVMAAYELRELCRNPNHIIFGDLDDELRALALIQSDNSIHDSIRNIVMCAFEGEGLDMTLVSPIATK